MAEDLSAFLDSAVFLYDGGGKCRAKTVSNALKFAYIDCANLDAQGLIMLYCDYSPNFGCDGSFMRNSDIKSR